MKAGLAEHGDGKTGNRTHPVMRTVGRSRSFGLDAVFTASEGGIGVRKCKNYGVKVVLYFVR